MTEEDFTVSDDILDEETSYGGWLRQQRQSLNWTQAKLAEQSGLTNVTISLIESGKSKNPNSKTRKKIRLAIESAMPDRKKTIEEASEAAAKQDEENLEFSKIGKLQSFEPHNPESWPEASGIYMFYDITDRPIYIGKSSKSMKGRIKEHFEKFWFREPIVVKAYFLSVDDDDMISPLERLFIEMMGNNILINKNLLSSEAKVKRKEQKQK